MSRTLSYNFSLHPKFDKNRRSSAAAAPFIEIIKMEFGKVQNYFLRFFILIFILSCHSTLSLSPSKLRGGLVYSEEHGQGPIYLNPQTYTLTRNVDTSTLVSYMSFIDSFVKLYEGQCDTTTKKNEETKTAIKKNEDIISNFIPRKEIYVINTVMPMHEHAYHCKRAGGRLPEIRSIEEKEDVRKMATMYGIKRFAAGIEFNVYSGRFQFLSDGLDVKHNSPFPDMEYGGNYGPDVWKTGSYGDDNEIGRMAGHHMVTYLNPQALFVCRLASRLETNQYKDKAVCERPMKPVLESHVNTDVAQMLSISTHSCKRDRHRLVAAAKAAVKNAQAATDLKISETSLTAEQLAEFLPHFDEPSRKKRALEPIEDLFDPSLIEKSISDVAFLIESNLPGMVKKSEEMKTLKDVFHQLKPKSTLKTWISSMLGSISSSDVLRAKRNPIGPFGQREKNEIKCLKRTKCFRKRSIQEEKYKKLHFQREAKKMLIKFLLRFHEKKARKELKKRSTRSITYEKVSNNNNSNGIEKNESLIKNENETFLYLNNDLQLETTTELQVILDREERALPLVPILGGFLGTAMAGNTISSAFNGGAPLSWFGKPLGKLFGFVSQEELQRVNDLIDKHAMSIDALHVNDVETRMTVNQLLSSRKGFEERIAKAFRTVTSVILQQDLKAFIQFLISMLESNVNKIVLIGLAASTGHTTTLALSQQELSNVADNAMKEKGLKLNTDISSVKMSMMKIGDDLKLVFEIPILIEDQLFHLFRVDAIPLFENNTMYIPEVDAQYIGISKTGSDYVTLEKDEFARCITDSSLCTVSSPMNTMTNAAHCSITTYVKGNMTCALIESDKPATRYIHVKGNHTIFSVPEPVEVYIKCDDSTSPSKTVESTFTMKNMGEVTFRSGCTINFLDGTRFQTPAMYMTEQLEASKIFEVIGTYTIPKNARIKRFYNHQYLDIAPLETKYEFPTLKAFTNEVFHPTKSLGFLAKFFLACLILGVMILSCLCYWRPIRVCLGNSKIFVCFEKIEADQIKDPLQKEKLRSILKTGLSKAKSTSDLVLDTLNTQRRSRGMKRARSAVTFSENTRTGNEISSDEEMDDLITLRRDRVKMVYQKDREENDTLTRHNFNSSRPASQN